MAKDLPAVGISSDCECGKTIEETLTNIKNAGFRNVMVIEKGKTLESALQLALSLGLNIPFVHLNCLYANDLYAIGEANKRYIAGINSGIKLCGKYNIPIAVLHATIGDSINTALPPSQHALNSFNEILSVAEENNIQIALENADALNAEHLYYLLDNIGPACLGFCYDCGHHNLYLQDIDLMKKYGNRCIAVHLHYNFKDFQAGMDFTRDLHLLPFDGKIDFEKTMSDIAQSTYNNVIMLELHKEACGEPQLYTKRL